MSSRSAISGTTTWPNYEPFFFFLFFFKPDIMVSHHVAAGDQNKHTFTRSVWFAVKLGDRLH